MVKGHYCTKSGPIETDEKKLATIRVEIFFENAD